MRPLTPMLPSRSGLHGDGSPEVVLVTADEEVLDHALVAAASAGVELTVVGDPQAVRAVWSSAVMIMVGIDLAPRLVRLALPRRSDTFVLGPADRGTDLATSSAPLGAGVVALPDASGWLAGALADVSAQGRESRTVAVLPGAGGAGASTMAVATAMVAARRGMEPFLVDVDPWAGGLDLLVGAEQLPGWRWPRLLGASGQLGDLRRHVVEVDGVRLLSHDRAPGFPLVPPDALAAVLASGARTHSLVVVDLARHDPSDMGRTVLRSADLVVLVVPARIRALAAAGRLVEELASQGVHPELVVRTTRMSGLPAEAVASSLGLVAIAVVADDPEVRRAAERGEPPGRSGRSGVARAAEQIVDRAFSRPAAGQGIGADLARSDPKLARRAGR